MIRSLNDGKICNVLPLLITVSVLLLLGGGALGCSGDTTGLASPSQGQTFWALQMNQQALNLALTADSTFQLSAVALDATGTPLSRSDSTVHYYTSDSSVTVSPTGFVVARYPTAQTSVFASLTTQGVTLTDTVLIQVTQTPPLHPIRTFSIHPVVGDSAKRSYDFFLDSVYILAARATDAAGDTVCNANACSLLVHYTSANPSVAIIDPTTGTMGTVQDTGHVVFGATTWAYGVALRDSVDFTVGYIIHDIQDIAQTIQGSQVRASFVNSFTVNPIIMGVGATVTFVNDRLNKPIDLVFDPLTGVDTASQEAFRLGTIPPTGSGNIPVFGGDSTIFCCSAAWYAADNRARRFSVPGVYSVHSTIIPSDTIQFIIQLQH